ncbi:MAG TPA: TOPRIM nucleotidyl transferase/hydrolase domain-containing protein [Rhizomicrobium sp.]|nr:TOPRIM nucleotidyl transferase/hydrolase domain-containing protein [Rhizomicrobium sp.]
MTDCSLRSAEVSGRRPQDAWSAELYAAKLHTFNTEIAEGFFARCVVLVEGVGDKAVLNAAYSIAKRNPHAEGIVIVDVTGKNNLDKPIVIFDELDIPCYWVFDNDRGEGQGKPGSIKANHILQRLGGVAPDKVEDWPEGIFDRYAAWDYKLEDYVSEKAGRELFDSVSREVAEGFHIQPDVCLKFPASASFMLGMLAERGVQFGELAAIIERVDYLLG